MNRGRTVVPIPISEVRVLNSRERNLGRFNELVQSIGALGLKRPITVCKREGEGSYDLVCGERRLDAFSALGQADVPALLIKAAVEDCILMGLVENIARRRHSPMELLRDIGRLAKHYRTSEIASKLDLAPERVRAIVFLLKRGEERLLSAVERGIVPPTLAIEIAKAKSPKLQGALLEAHVGERHTTTQIAKMRKLVEQRQRSSVKNQTGEEKINSRDLVRAYRRETDREQLLRRKADLANARLTVLIGALKTLLSERMFASILRAEGLDQLPLPVLQRLSGAERRLS
jgi:ParB family transcriptional regulator, chromosome partitioning protein